MNLKNMNQQPQVLHSHPAQGTSGISIQLEQLNVLLNNLESKLNTLDIAEKVKHLQAIDTFFAKSNQHLSAMEALSPKVTTSFDESEAMEISDDLFEGHLEENDHKQPDILEIERLLESSSYPENVFDYAKKELEQLNSATYRSSERYKQFQFLRNLLTLPWAQMQEETLDIKKARAILNKNH